MRKEWLFRRRGERVKSTPKAVSRLLRLMVQSVYSDREIFVH
jgi:HSP90 family molecular chaperone